MELAYVAHSARCALLLDADGICRWFLLKDDDERIAATAKRCVGAQFVATLDPEATGLLGHEPAVGKNVLFARVDDGRVSLVRFGPLVQFDTLGSARERETEEPAAEAVAPQAATSEPAATVPAAPLPAASEPAASQPAASQRATLAPVIPESVIIEPELPEPTTAEHPHLTLVPRPPTSEPATLRGVAAPPVVIDDRKTEHDLFDEDELATAAGDRAAYRPSGYAIRSVAASDEDSIQTAAFSRGVIVVRAAGRGMLPRRG